MHAIAILLALFGAGKYNTITTSTIDADSTSTVCRSVEIQRDSAGYEIKNNGKVNLSQVGQEATSVDERGVVTSSHNVVNGFSVDAFDIKYPDGRSSFVLVLGTRRVIYTNTEACE